MRHLVVTLALMVGITASAQEKDITKFLGIPIDGTKSEVAQKLKEKGFTPSSYDEYTLEGEFNGRDVTVSPVTNNNKVYRIAVFDRNYMSETDIKIRFNKLCDQFDVNYRYISIAEHENKKFQIPESEDISYEMTVHNKRYQASYFQKASITKEEYAKIVEKSVDEVSDKDFEAGVFARSVFKQVWFMIDEQYGKYRILMFYDNAWNQATGEDL